MSRRLVLGSIIAVLTALTVPPSGSATSIAGPNGKIVFTSGRANSEVPNPADGDDSKARIWVVDYPSGTPVQVTTQPVALQHRHPNWSPDHTRIVYAAGASPNPTGEYALWIVDLRTKVQEEFVKPAPKQDRPTWSPNGARIAYGSGGDLWVKGVAPGSTPERITNTPAIDEERAVWSPDGNTLYYNRGPEADRDLYKKSPVTLGGVETPILAGATSDWQPALSPDGKRLCFLRGPQSDEADLWTVNVDGSSPLVYSATSMLGDLNCVWSPDQTRILFTRGAYSGGQLATKDLAGLDLDILGFNVDKHFDGNSDWATNFSPKCDPKTADVGVNSFVTLTLSCTDPDFGFGAAPPTSTPLDDDALEIASSPAHGTLGGLDNYKVIYTPQKDFKGTDTFTYTGGDGVSESAPATVTIRVGQPGAGGGDTTPPLISDVRVSVKRWRLGKGLATISKAPVGTTISFKLSEAARSTLTFQRARPGRRVGRSCVKPTSGNSAKRACTRYVGAGSIALSAKAGQSKVRFQGRLAGKRTLVPGGYRVLVGAQDAAGNRAQPRTGPTFTIVSE